MGAVPSAAGACACVSCPEAPGNDPASENILPVQEVFAAEETEDALANRVFRFQVTLQKDPDGLGGFGFAHSSMGRPSMLVVQQYRPDGVLARWNAQQYRQSRSAHVVRAGDHVVCVDGVSELLDMKQILVTQDKVILAMERWPLNITVLLRKHCPTDKYGVRTEVMLKEDGSKGLLVAAILEPSLLSAWNTIATNRRRYYEIVPASSEILQVSGCSGIEQMQEALQHDSEVDITFRLPK